MTRLLRVSETEQLGQNILACLYDQLDISDLTATLLDGRKLHLHRPILKIWSPVFRAIFNDLLVAAILMSAASPHILEINIADPAVHFEELVKFMYTGQIVLTTDNISAIQEMAEKYKIDLLISKCRQAHDEEKRRVRIEEVEPMPTHHLEKRTQSARNLSLGRHTLDGARVSSPPTSPRNAERTEERVHRYTSPNRDRDREHRPLSPRPRARNGEPLDDRNERRTLSPPRGRSPARRSEIAPKSSAPEVLSHYCSQPPRPAHTRRSAKSPERMRSPERLRVSSPAVAASFAPASSSSSSSSAAHNHTSMSHSASVSGLRLQARGARPDLAQRKPPPKPPVSASTSVSVDERPHNAADERKRQIERLKAYWSEKSDSKAVERPAHQSKLNTSTNNVEPSEEEDSSRGVNAAIPNSYSTSPLSIFASTQHTPALSAEPEGQRVGSLPRVTSAGAVFKTPDPKAVKAKKKEEEKKEKDKKKEEKAKAEKAEKERLLLLQRVLVIESEHNNIVKDMARHIRPASPRSPRRAVSPGKQRAVEAPVAPVSTPPPPSGPVSSSLPVTSSSPLSDASDPLDLFKRR